MDNMEGRLTYGARKESERLNWCCKVNGYLIRITIRTRRRKKARRQPRIVKALLG